MDVFDNTAAAICGVLAVGEFVGFVVYSIVASKKLRQKLISMGRLIPMMPMMVVPVPVPIQTVPQVNPPYQYQQLSSNANPSAPPAQPPGFQDMPPSYSQIESKQ